MPGISNSPEIPWYLPYCRITVLGSNSAHLAASPPYSLAMVWSLLPMFGLRSPAMSTNALNRLGCRVVNCTAQVPPMDQPTMPQFSGFGLTPKFEIRYGTTSLVRWTDELP
ncbi:Uncharacterised protein [Mycobacteroides abscessus subsp. abscessus]|nr:Uncharacterised protein [Mycobacteroides abscessus subsp. abscessus]